ncbi:MAG: tRNA (adenosine(37)-N6)-threonylcarbamoyltransferase complex dimerization subunit type 1 TsaB [Actinomyces sp.]|uniref:tRNA (adenosine(37)-N6)-threonylcarbamoyltransferase complex dimerization subunit type 1 TsaB n=1 Tax=Actinomyces sp. TaxID=29317 RepID=UPI0026DBC7CA|nr:tRNA (adenosine(37)-N6)-threonylcarbamoyltransferase complex dimerization subunit type 1 TsaB [Actinomyces sp.]MDO4242507.1 tRNA (adenosine(37)-N6)-threonylcarbamoyltransferase complex dimerization subunit type 1 TsaB [Actinomyces sp.]
MRIVSIDSSLGTQLVVAGADPGPDGLRLTVLAQAEQADARRHAESLGPMLQAVLTDPEVAGQDLDAVVAATGPAPFTGLRAGLVAARALGRARGLAVHGVPSLDAVARAALDELADDGAQGPAAGATVLVATDARRSEVYTARYRAKGPDDVDRLGPIEVLTPERAAQAGPADAVAGSGAALYDGIAQGRRVLAPVSGDARTQVRIAVTRLAQGIVLGTEPLYLRHADVQMPAGRKRVR